MTRQSGRLFSADMIVATMNESWAQGLDRWRKSASVQLTPGLHDVVTEAT